MRVTPSHGRLALAAFCAAQLWILRASAQPQQLDDEESFQQQEAEKALDDQATVDEMMAELLVADDEDSDLAWLYSDRVYEPSDLGGRPIPAPALPERGEGTSRTWDPRWRRFELGDYILTGTALATAIGASLIPASSTPWRQRIGIDEDVRDTISIRDYDRGVWARDTSDVLVALSVTYPLLVDSLIVTYWYRSSEDVATEMALITAEALSVSSAIHGLTAGLVGRERPYVRECGGRLNPELDDCNGNKAYRSFFSGHTSQAFAGAGVACSHHIHHDVFGDPFADGLACGVAITAAAMTGTMRIVGNQHYLTDVSMGAAVGFLSGLGVPWLLHYGPPARQDVERERDAIRWYPVPTKNGIGVGGVFR